ncbi:hypothetical protein FSP39_025497 [Pinctada imbricata]|uniref:Uncharacterized protein n=1 Tax=Pinctada imbricata TaxID=66713 RepID=A0AA88Y7E6_PINIB|nr:hypothetical protein FSP39_025497 [Pinctada imbricata]
MDLNFPLVIICLLLPMNVYTKPTPRDKDSVVADLRRLIDLLKREKSPYDVNDEQTDTDPYDDNDEQTDTDSYEDIHDFDQYEEYVLPDDMHWGGDEWMELEEDGLGHGYDIIDNMTLGLDEIPLDLFASFEVFDGDEYDRPFIDFQNLPVQIAQNKDHHRSKYPKVIRLYLCEVIW